MVSIRHMRPDDADAVRALDALAFAAAAPRTRENVFACLALNPLGCFVAEDGGPVGYVFSRRWGQVGWVGTFGVHPCRRGRHIGLELLQAALASLQAAGCTTIGLETMPDSPYNVGLYARAGFRLTFPTLTLTRRTRPPLRPPPYALLSQVGEEAGLAAARQTSLAAWPGLDYGPEAANARRFAWGQTLLIGWPAPWALALVRTAPRREGPAESVADVSALAVAAPARAQLPQALQAVDAFAADERLGAVRLAVNASDGAALQTLLAQGFRVAHVRLRMLLQGESVCPPGVDLSRWAM
mgnify:CR=1 FL=1